MPAGAEPVSLGEGNTPLTILPVRGVPVAFKLEMLNPTGSFKDRGTAVLVSALRAAGVREVVEDSSGNAGASLAAYAARAGIAARIFIPESASGPKRVQIESSGAQVVPVPGPRSKAAEAVREAAERGATYASHAYLPHGLAGIATIAFELVSQLGAAPAAVVAPAGHGSLITGLWLGFRSLRDGGVIRKMPRLIAVQAAACAPIHAAFEGRDGSAEEGETVAEGIRMSQPARKAEVLAAVRETGGSVEMCSDAEILQGRRELAVQGLLVETTSAAVWPALEKLLKGESPVRRGPIVAIISGHGLKTPNPV